MSLLGYRRLALFSPAPASLESSALHPFAFNSSSIVRSIRGPSLRLTIGPLSTNPLQLRTMADMKKIYTADAFPRKSLLHCCFVSQTCD
jgi:hypothetical protein